MRPKNRFVSLIVCALIVVGSSITMADVGDARYCGIDAVYASAKWLGLSPSLGQLTRRDFVSTVDGSTGNDLIAAANFAGFSLRASQLNGAGSLRANLPAILHTKRLDEVMNSDAKPANHWLLCTSYDNGVFNVIDDGVLKHVTPVDLLRRWEGVAMCVMRNASEKSWTSHMGNWPNALAFLITGTAVLIGASFNKGQTSQIGGRGLVRGGALLALVILATGVTAFLTPTGTLAGWLPLTSTTTTEAAPRISFDEWSAFGGESVVLIDARDAASFAAGTLPDAVNVVPATDTAEIRKIAAAASGKTVMVFCQSRSCPLADQLAAHLLHVLPGLKVRVLDAGYVGWKKWERSRS